MRALLPDPPFTGADLGRMVSKTEMKVPFAKPSFTEKDLSEILSNMKSVLVSGWLTCGKNVETLEKRFSEVIGTKEAVAVNSCTAALHSTLVALSIESGDEVIVPSNTFVATANAALCTGARPVFADSDPDKFNLSPEDVEKKVTRKTKAIIAVHLAGNPCDMKELSEIAHDHRITLLEDCAHAHGSKSNGRNCGTFGVAGAFSFYATKIMTAAEGGMVVTDDQKMAQRIRRIRSHGRGGYGPIETTELGYNYRMSDIHAVIALSQLQHLSDFVVQRQRIANAYDRLFSETDWVKPQLIKEGNVCPYYVYLLKVAKEAPISRDQLAQRLGEKGIATSVLYYPVHTQPFYAEILDKDPGCPVAVDLGKRTIAVPMYNGMTPLELEYIRQQWREICKSPVEQVATIN